ncbi:hypothetical protein HanXRQr2_Chr17g0818391 [Helianthus annuus]|uniref:Uncharacterized protein n=1 Tax=Helianthus annuus TaxID=4232 RepID=A0A9K3DM42_HELAN|nr:hypothetical protein HanXRQr2_Chr17g0818391 [Helianthus annuus]
MRSLAGSAHRLAGCWATWPHRAAPPFSSHAARVNLTGSLRGPPRLIFSCF